MSRSGTGRPAIYISAASHFTKWVDLDERRFRMKHSNERILTSHAGSLPRPDDVRALLAAKHAGEPYDQAAFATRVRAAVVEVVRKQIENGIDIVNDGELSKINFTSYA